MDNRKINIESLKRKNIHEVPEGYFDELPLKIQTRINNEKAVHKPVLFTRMQLTWSLTAAMIIFILGWVFYPASDSVINPEQMLADVDSEYLIEYLYEENVSTDEILASIDESFLLDEMTEMESESIEGELSDEDLESIYSEMDYSTEIM